MTAQHPPIMKRGYTIFEIIIVVIIAGILASIALPNFSTSIEKSRTQEALRILEALHHAEAMHDYEIGGYADISDLDVTVANSENFKQPTVDIASRVISIERNSTDNPYTLTMTADGVLTCTDGGSGLCKKIGF